MRGWLVLALLMVGSFAGCFGKDDAADASPAPTLPPRPTATTEVVSHRGNQTVAPAPPPASPFRAEWLPVAGRDAREPTVGVDSKGNLYYAARDYSGGNSPPVSATQTPIMKSTDGGRNWTDVSPRLPTGDREPPRSGDPMVVVDPWTDRIFQIELYDLVCNWLVFSDDAGQTWTSNPKACSSLVVDHQTIGAGPPALAATVPVGYENVVYVCVNQIADSHCSRSLDGGITFESFHPVYPGTRADAGGVCGGIHGHVLVAPDGVVYLPREYCGDAFVAISRDDGLTWELKDVDGGLGEFGNDPNMAFDAAGNVYYAFTSAETQAVWVTWTKDQGVTWSAPVRASPPHLTAANHPSITAGSAGRIGLTFLGTESDLGADPENWVWNAYMTASIDALSPGPTFTTLRASPDPVYRGDCRFIRCGYVREFIDASVAPDGSFWGAFVDACLGEGEAKYKQYGADCNTKAKDYGEGNGHLAYVGHFVGAGLYEGERQVSGGG